VRPENATATSDRGITINFGQQSQAQPNLSLLSLAITSSLDFPTLLTHAIERVMPRILTAQLSTDSTAFLVTSGSMPRQLCDR
jgi:hypothetical protein